jgi:uncharacterized protein YndB with AHSA1/START domain
MKEFKKYYKLNASPADVYNALTNPVMIEIWTGEPVVMSAEPGSEFSLWDGAINGMNIEFIANQLIVQRWYFGEEEDSVVTIKLFPDKKATRIELHQTNIPDEAFDDIVEGWNEEYFGNLMQLFEE